MVFINRISKMSCALFWIFMAAATRGLERAQKGAGSEAFTDLEGALSTTVQGRWKFPTENEGECLSPIQEVGICIMVRRCPGLLTIRDINQLRRFICGFEGKTPLLCCPYSYQNSTPSPDPVATPAKPQFANQKPDKGSPPDQQETVIYPGTLPNDKYPNRLPQQPRPAPVFPQFGIASVRPEQPARPQGQHPPKERQPSQSRPRPKPPSLPLPASSVDPSMGSIRPFPPGRPAKPNFLPQTCGFSNVSLSRIVGGSDAQPGAWPWMAAIYVRYNGLSTHTCGGALVSSKHIITAAHCVGIGTRQQTLPPSIFVVRLGDHNLQTTNDLPLGSTFEVAAAGIRRHSAFDPRTYLNDIALLLLTAEVPFTRYIQPVCLPYEAVPENIAGHYGFVTGWGYTKFAHLILMVLFATGRGSGSDVLQQAQVKIWSQKECAAAFQKEVTISEEYICAGDGLGLQDSCQQCYSMPVITYYGKLFFFKSLVT
ncbi:proclotting enzyme-like isoform X2 [Varroa jacobsoni]|uniref:proclotting enzyme-like isoform X2 n=1 Tax=Varroa jacobsoni TaxID=62625 RepID=UPI000BF750A2|nr:proclotting enzyme-like isoform X2 [Varroa jacobsoni]